MKYIGWAREVVSYIPRGWRLSRGEEKGIPSRAACLMFAERMRRSALVTAALWGIISFETWERWADPPTKPEERGPLKITYDPECNMAYVYLKYPVEDGESVSREHVHTQKNGEYVLDFDADGRLLGVEVFNASRRLPEKALAEAEIETDEET